MDTADNQNKSCRFLVLGGTCPMGQHLIKQALTAGFYVTTLVKQPIKNEVRHKHLRIVLGDVFREDSMKLATDEHCDAVISFLDQFNWPFQDTVSFYSKSMECIINIMKKRGLTRLITKTSWCLREDPEYVWYMKWFVKPLYNGNVLKNMAEMEDYLETTDPTIRYTIVRPTILTDDPPKSEYKIVEDCEYILDGEGTISRYDVADFMLKLAQNNEYSRKAVAIANPLPTTEDAEN